jgi:hypothetical protein
LNTIQRGKLKQNQHPACHWHGADFGISATLTITQERMLSHKTSKKVRKSRSFLSKRAVFMVDDTGLEPVTSRTSSGCSTS